MYLRIREGVRCIEECNGKPWDECSERISRSLLARCKGAGTGPDPDVSFAPALSRVDHVLMGTGGNVFAIEGKLDDPAQRRASVSITQAALVTTEESDRLLDAVNTRDAGNRDLGRQRAAMVPVQHPGAGAPCMAG